MPERWQLDLCFKAELTRLPETTAENTKRLEVDIVLVTEPPFGSVARVEFDPKLLRMRQPSDGGVIAPLRRVPGISEDTYGPELEHLVSQPGLSNLSETEWEVVGERFDAHLTYRVKARPRDATYYRCTSLGSLYEGQDVILYVPPADLTAILGVRTPTNRRLPTEPTLYPSIDEALVVPTLFLLWAGDDAFKDAAVMLESGGAAQMPRTRVVVSSLRDLDNGLPYLRGSLKQVAWASELREDVVSALSRHARAYKLTTPKWKLAERNIGRKNSAPEFDAWTLTRENLGLLVEELKYAEDSKGWIDHRRAPFKWLLTRAEGRRALDPALTKD